MVAVSNGEPEELQAGRNHAGIKAHLHGSISVHDARAFNPAPAVYQHFRSRSGAAADDTWLISGNPFDICGARAAGWHALWLQRAPATVFDPWEFAPNATAADFTQAARRFVDGNTGA